jgi:hypothetical protein
MLLTSKADYNSARTVPGKSRASPRSWKMRASSSHNVPDVGAKYNSSAPRGWFGHSPCPPLGADPLGRLSDSSPRSRCRTTPRRANFREYAPKASDKSARPVRRSRRPPPDGCAYTTPAKPSVCAAFRTRMSIARPVRGLPPWRREQAFAPKEAIQPLFLSHLVTVLRETPKIRLMPRREARSW